MKIGQIKILCVYVCMNISYINSRLMEYMVAVFDGSEILTR